MQPPAEPNEPSSAYCPSARRGRQGEKRIVLVGASVRSAAQSAQRAGFQVIGIDLFGDRDTRQACQQHYVVTRENDATSIAQSCLNAPVIPVGGLDWDDPRWQRLAAILPQLRRPRAWDSLRDVDWLRSLSESAGIQFPRTMAPSAFQTSDRSNAHDASVTSARWLCKRRGSCGGLGVGWYSQREPTSQNEVLQQWIPGRSFGATLMSHGSTTELLGVCRSMFTRLGERPFVYAGSIGPVDVPTHVSRLLATVGATIAARTEHRGIWNVDFVLDRSNTAWLLEINPRWSGSSELIERRLMDQGRTDSLMAVSMQALKGNSKAQQLAEDELAEDGTASQRCGSVYWKRVVFARCAIRFDRGPISKLLRDHESLHDIPEDGTVIARGEPVCTLIARLHPAAPAPFRRYRSLVRHLNAIGRT